jgi:D-arabinose 1-dehydrogenase-like Zn-dependent alcohol dehydrogenase
MGYPTSARAAVLAQYREPIEVRELPVPTLEDDALLVRVEAATMCGTDVHIADGDLAATGYAKLPLVLGHEIVGRIVALGPQRRTDSLGRPLAEGDLITWAYPWCDRCYWCTIAKQPTLCPHADLYGWGPSDAHPYLTGGFAEYCYVKPRCRTVLVPPGLAAPLAASATCAFRTVVHAFEALGALRSTDTVVVQGAGPVGLYALAYAQVMGAARVVVIGAPARRLQVAARWGATEVIDVQTTTVEERRERVVEMTDGRGADVVVECAGVGDAFTEGMDLVRRGGRYLVIGAADPKPSAVHAMHFNLRQISVVGTVSADISHYHRAMEFLTRHGDRFDFPAVLGRTFDLAAVDDALGSVRAGGMKPIITPWMGRE